jgi:inosine-uridine nucleoside N-ribohydrolase
VTGVVMMGGAATVSGNVNPAAEANIHSDPYAADRVLTAPWPMLTMVGLDVTEQVIMDEVYFHSLAASRTGAYIGRSAATTSISTNAPTGCACATRTTHPPSPA